MASQSKNKKSFLNFLLVGLVAVCVVLLLTQVVTDTVAEVKSNRSNEGYAVVLQIDAGSNPATPELTVVPTQEDLPEDATDSVYDQDDKYGDTGE